MRYRNILIAKAFRLVAVKVELASYQQIIARASREPRDSRNCNDDSIGSVNLGEPRNLESSVQEKVEGLWSALTPRHYDAFVKQLRPCCQPFFTVPGVTPIEETAGRVLTPRRWLRRSVAGSGFDVYRVA